jgi:hypothetical protein
LRAADTSVHAEKLVNDYLHRPAEELDDLEADPDELYNIAGDPAVCEVKMELRENLRTWMLAQGDVHYSQAFFDALPDDPCPVTGCMDPLALTYDPLAGINDSSMCEYETGISKTQPYPFCNLMVQENSVLISVSSPGVHQAIITDVNGILLHRLRLSRSVPVRAELNLPGLYLIRLNGNGKTRTVKIACCP